MLLSIITINRNNADGLKKTIASVNNQSCKQFEYIIIDGASSDGSVDVIKGFEASFGERLKWISEPDKGIYNAMNKGLKMATGEYIQILNSGDVLADGNVEEILFHEVKKTSPAIIYGNMMKSFPDGKRFRDKCFAGQEITLYGMYKGTLNHDPAWIKRDLFDRFGFYDEKLKIVSDWKWYLQAIILGAKNVQPLNPNEIQYLDLDITIFDMAGISETNIELRDREKRQEIESLIKRGILKDYDDHAKDIEMVIRLHRHRWAYLIVRFIERVLFKFEKISKKRV